MTFHDQRRAAREGSRVRRAGPRIQRYASRPVISRRSVGCGSPRRGARSPRSRSRPRCREGGWRRRRRGGALDGRPDPGAELVELPGDEEDPYLGDVVSVDRGRAALRRGDRGRARHLRPGARHGAVHRHRRIVRARRRARRPSLEGSRRTAPREGAGAARRYRGHEVDTAGDGFFATFDGPGRAVRCAEAIVRSVGSLGIEVRAGLHTGEVETTPARPADRAW